MSRATKKEIGLAHLKTMGLGFDFEFLQRVICVCEHVLSLCIYRRSLCIAKLAREEGHLKVESRGKIAFLFS